MGYLRRNENTMNDITITTMCALINEQNEWLFIERTKNWKGLALPGGHIEEDESITECIIREILEETGLTLLDLTFKGIVHFYNTQTKERYLVFNYISKSFSGCLRSECAEGKLLWINQEDFKDYQFADGMEKRFDLFTRIIPTEMFVEWNEMKGYSSTKIVQLADNILNIV